MPILPLTNPTLSTTYDSTEHDANFADFAAKFNAGLLNADCNAAMALALSKLAASYQEVWLELMFSALDFAGAWPAACADPTAPLRDEILDFAPLPGTDADTAWVITDVSWMCNDTGTASGSFDLCYGAYDGSGDLKGTVITLTSNTIPFKGGDKGNQGRALENGSVTVIQSSTVRGLYLVVKTQGTVVMDDQGAGGSKPSWLKVRVALRRQIQA